ncbi:MAG: metallophosphoesterase [Chloroflexota bacterium]
MSGLGLVFSMFSSNTLKQLVFLSPLLIIALGFFLVPFRVLLKRKNCHPLLRWVLLTTLVFYLAFSGLVISLPLTGTSYGAPLPVIITFGVLYLLMLDVVLTFVRWAVRFYWLVKHWKGVAISYLLYQTLVLSVLFYAFYIEPQWIEVTQTQITLAKLPSGTPPMKVAVISDIHVERWTQRETETIRQLDALQPDLLLLVGDYINVDYYDPQGFADLKRFFGSLHARYGVYAAPGGVDGYDLEALLEGSAVQLLDDAYAPVTINGATLYLVGIRSRIAEMDYPIMQEVQKDIPPDATKILLYHYPDLISESATSGYDMYFAGHTHGGQIALPFFGAIFTSGKYGRTYAAGLYNLGGTANTRLYITRGLGLEGVNMPRARLFARPEISVITFVPRG